MATASQIIQIVPADGWYFVRTVTGNELPVVDSIAVWALDSAGNVSGLIGQVQSGPDNVSPCAKLVSLPPTTGSFKHFRNLSSQERLSANSATLPTDEEVTAHEDAIDQFEMAMASYKEAGGTTIGLIDRLWALVDQRIQAGGSKE